MIRLLDHALRLVLGGLFIYAGVIKALDPAAFLTDVDGYRLLPRMIAVAVALYLPWLEIAAGLSLALGVLRRGATLVLLTLMIAFIAALLSAWLRGLDVSCGCFGRSGAGGRYAWWFARNAAIAAGLVGVMGLEANQRRRT